jgi:hypothetical protein
MAGSRSKKGKSKRKRSASTGASGAGPAAKQASAERPAAPAEPIAGPPPRPTERIRRALFAPVSVAPLVYFRILFGAIMFWEVTRYFSHDWIQRYYVEPEFFFAYFGLP